MKDKGRWIPFDTEFSDADALDNLKVCRDGKEYESYSVQSKKECNTLIKAYEGDPDAQIEARKWYGAYESELAAFEETIEGWICMNINQDYLKKCAQNR